MFLRKLPASAKSTRFSGEVQLDDGFRGVPGVHIRLSGPNGKITETVTNSEGVYEIYDLPPGKYSTSITVPNGYSVWFPVISGAQSIARGPTVDRQDTSVDLTPDGGVSVSFVLQADTRLVGRMSDAAGKPVKGVCVDFEPVLGRSENGRRFFKCTNDDGVFSVTNTSPGKYWIVAHDEIKAGDVKSKSTVYYPGVRDRDRAAIVSVEAGKPLEHLDIQLPPDEKRYRISGRMQFEDGVPLAKSTVSFASIRGAYTETTQTDADGKFGLLVVAGLDGELRGEAAVGTRVLKSCPQFKVEPTTRGIFSVMAAGAVRLAAESDQEDLKLILPFMSCKDWPSVTGASR